MHEHMRAIMYKCIHLHANMYERMHARMYKCIHYACALKGVQGYSNNNNNNNNNADTVLQRRLEQ